MSGAEQYEHEHDRPRSDYADFAVPARSDRPLPLDLPDHYDDAPPDDDFAAFKGISLGLALGVMFWLGIRMAWRWLA
jgi:hypothetical protein